MLYEGYAPHGVAVLVESATDNPTRTVANVRNAFNKHGGNLATTGSVAFQFKRMGVFRLNPEGIDQDDLELYLIDHGLEEMGESTGEKGEPQLVVALRVRGLRHAAEGARGPRHQRRSRPSTSTSARRRPSCPRRRRPRCSKLIDKLEQDEDVQKVYHTLA